MALVLAGCGHRAVAPPAMPSPASEFRRLELPGFSIDVLAGLGMGDGNIADYRAGDVTMLGSGRLLEVSWHVGSLYLGDQLTQVVRARMAASFQGHRYELRAPQTTAAGVHLAGVLEFTIEDREFAFANIGCGERVVVVMIGGPQLAALRTHVLRSFDCRPVPATELALQSGAPIGVDQPDLLADWYQIPNEQAFLVSNDVFAVMFQVVGNDEVLTAEYRNAIPDLMKALPVGTWSSTRQEKRWARDGERVFQHGTIDAFGQRRPALFVAWRCDDQAILAFALPLIPVPDLGSVVDLLMKVRCARPGDPPLRLREKQR